MPRPRRGNRERFESFVKVDEKSGCWIWTGGKNKTGYGQFKVRTPDGKLKSTRAHRFSYQEYIGEIPDGMFVLHNCDRPECVSPHCLFLGDHKTNMADRDAKGRQSRGSDRPAAKLSEEDVLEIRRLYATGDVTQRQLARQFGVSQRTICQIVRREIWKHI